VVEPNSRAWAMRSAVQPLSVRTRLGTELYDRACDAIKTAELAFASQVEIEMQHAIMQTKLPPPVPEIVCARSPQIFDPL